MQKILHMFKAKRVRSSLAQFQTVLRNAGKLWELKIERKLLNKAHNAM